MMNSDNWYTPEESLVKRFAVERVIDDKLSGMDLDITAISEIKYRLDNVEGGVADNATNITDLTDALDVANDNIANNAQGIINNYTQITTNTNAILTLQPQVATNTTNIASLQTLIDNLPSYSTQTYDSLTDVTDPQEGILYIIGTTPPLIQYIWLNGSWLNVGSFEVDLSNLVKTTDWQAENDAINASIGVVNSQVTINEGNIQILAQGFLQFQGIQSSHTGQIHVLDQAVTALTNMTQVSVINVPIQYVNAANLVSRTATMNVWLMGNVFAFSGWVSSTDASRILPNPAFVQLYIQGGWQEPMFTIVNQGGETGQSRSMFRGMRIPRWISGNYTIAGFGFIDAPNAVVENDFNDEG